MEVKEKNKKLLIVVGVLLLFGGVTLAYFVSKAILGGNGGSTSVTTAVINGATLNVEGVLSFEDLDILPGHKTISAIKVTATGNNELIPYNLIWQGTNTLTTPLNFTIYKTSEEINTTSTCAKKSKQIGASKALLEECTIFNLDKLENEIANGTINKNETKVNLVKDEFITATSTGDIKYYYIILEYPNLDEPQNEDLNGTFEGEVTVEESNIKPDINIIAAYVVQDDGTYKQVEDIPQSGYQLNKDKSTCTNSAIPGWDTKEHRFYVDNLTTRGTNCNLYFDNQPTASEIILINSKKGSGTPNFAKTSCTSGCEEATVGIYSIADPIYEGITTYFRGDVTDNYVKFAGFCWRIVRINGDGTIRLVYDGTTCHANGTSTIESIAKSNVTYNTSRNQSNYVGWTYEGQLQRPASNATETLSNVKLELDIWYREKIIGINAEKVIDGNFCNDREAETGASWAIKGSSFRYAAYKRIYTDHSPSVACNLDDVYILKAGLLTADEVMYAGGRDANNTKYYLYNGQNYWTMTPFNWDGDARVFRVDTSGYLSNPYVSGENGIRPVINLKSDVTFSDGDGTLNNPYVVEGA